MAYFDDSVLLEARSKALEANEQKFNKRPIKTQIHDVFLAGQDYVRGVDGKTVAEMKMATTQPTKIYYNKKTTFTDTTVKTCSPNGDLGGSGIITLTWAQLVNTFKVSEKIFAGNEYSKAEMIVKQIAMLENNLLFTRLNTAMLAYLEANRTQVNAISGGGSKNTWVGTPDFKATVANANLNRYYNYLLADMALNGYDGNLFDIHDLGWQADLAYYAAQGTANSVNTSFQFDGISQFGSKLIIPGSGIASTHYVVPEGGVAALFWNEGANKKGYKNTEGEWDTIESMIIPGLFYDVYIKEGCADTTSLGGATQDPTTDFEFTLNYALVKQPLDVANETPIFKYDILTT